MSIKIIFSNEKEKRSLIEQSARLHNRSSIKGVETLAHLHLLPETSWIMDSGKSSSREYPEPCPLSIMCLILHKWGKWKEYRVDVPRKMLSATLGLREHIEIRQKRYCHRCGKVDDQEIRIELKN